MLRVNRFVPILSLSVVSLAAAASAADTLPLVRVVVETASVRTRPERRGPVAQPATAGTVLETIDREDDWYWVILPPDQNGTRRSGWIQARDVEVVGEGEGRTVLRHFTEAVDEGRTRERDAAARAAAKAQARAERAERQQAAATARAERAQQAEAARAERVQREQAARVERAQREQTARAERQMREQAARRERVERETSARLERARLKLERARRAYEAATEQTDGAGSADANDQPATTPSSTSPTKAAAPKSSTKRQK